MEANQCDVINAEPIQRTQGGLTKAKNERRSGCHIETTTQQGCFDLSPGKLNAANRVNPKRGADFPGGVNKGGDQFPKQAESLPESSQAESASTRGGGAAYKDK